jgi:membrane protein DedA with SNARE-associated domain
MMQWEASAFGRPVLAIVLVASLALFPVILVPSGPSMWLAGMIFGYGWGFLIIMVGTTIGMVVPYWIGSLFRERLHVKLFTTCSCTSLSKSYFFPYKCHLIYFFFLLPVLSLFFFKQIAGMVN